MVKIIIIYSTTDGQTKAICEHMRQASQAGSDVDIVPIKDVVNLNLDQYSSIIIGASIRYGKHKAEVLEFVTKNKKILDKKNSAFFTVNVVARKPNKNSSDTNPYLKKFLNLTDWVPDIIGVFAGKIDYPRYGFWDRQIIRLIMYLTKGPTDTSKTYEFTDWNLVESFFIDVEKKSV